MSSEHAHPAAAPRLSVIIVNYNVKYFLEQCLHSVMLAGQHLPLEVIVVDNNSVDGSEQMVRDLFPTVTYIYNKKNVGFSMANNQGIRMAKGEYVVLLNPDTVVEEETFSSTIAFMDAHPDAGGLGVKMLDGKGVFLPESKRGLPTPRVAFYKIFGLATLFPNSKKFGQYHLSYLNEDEVHEVDVLSGAFMLMRMEALDKIGLLDEAFFMYGEDIDLSYRITQGGYKNYYFPKTRIIHYKGESTKKSSINYVFVFYNAMIIFARKHFSQKHANTFSLLINMAIYFRASLAILQRFLTRGLLALLDFGMIVAGLVFLTGWYSEYSGIVYPAETVQVALPFYGLAWMLSVFLAGGYDKPIRLSRVFRGLLWGSALVLTSYALLSEEYRFSRAVILLGMAWAFASITGLRLLLHLSPFSEFKLMRKVKKRFALVGSEPELDRIENLLKQTGQGPEFIAYINPEPGADNSSNRYITGIDKLGEALKIFRISEVIFSGKDLPAQDIISQMGALGQEDIDYKIAPPNSAYIIGSNSINAPGELYSILNVNAISRPGSQRNKRIFDFMLALTCLLTLPISIWFVQQKGQFLLNLFSVLFGQKTWVGYARFSEENALLPRIRKGILHPLDGIPGHNNAPKRAERANMDYARDYRWFTDLKIVGRSFAQLGRNPKRMV